MGWTIAIVLGTALGTAVLTAALLWWVFCTRLQPALEERMRVAQEEFERRVHAGVLAAGRELLPAFREQVNKGFQDALRESTGSLVADPAKAVSRSADLLEGGLRSIFGFKPPER